MARVCLLLALAITALATETLSLQDLGDVFDAEQSLVHKQDLEFLEEEAEEHNLLDRVDRGDLSEDDAQDLEQRLDDRSKSKMKSIEHKLGHLNRAYDRLDDAQSGLAKDVKTEKKKAAARKFKRHAKRLKNKYEHAEKVLKHRIKDSPMFKGAKLLAKKVNDNFKKATKKAKKKYGGSSSTNYKSARAKIKANMKKTEAYKSHQKLLAVVKQRYANQKHRLENKFKHQEKQLKKKIYREEGVKHVPSDSAHHKADLLEMNNGMDIDDDELDLEDEDEENDDDLVDDDLEDEEEDEDEDEEDDNDEEGDEDNGLYDEEE
mmetsp:Transcript_15547/g.37116  ORF Transcript_15547/g.37116 Transcript_15547/m.37116 type:complete len:319 (-) Transcript_15547:32-988(-)